MKTYLAPWTPALTPVGSGSKPGSAPPADSPATSWPVALESVGPESDGFVFDPTFESWKPVSPIDRGDNNTFRFILGNDVAVKAAQTGNISPWPDGALRQDCLAAGTRSRWLGASGKLCTGGVDAGMLVFTKAPRVGVGVDGEVCYGADARFVNDVTNCHWPMRGNDLRLHPAHHHGQNSTVMRW